MWQVLRMIRSACGGIVHRHVADGRHDIRHARGVVDVHLAAVGLDVELFGQRFRKRIDAVRTPDSTGRHAAFHAARESARA